MANSQERLPRTLPVSANGDLMSRISSFIPQIKAANEALSLSRNDISSTRVDTTLELDQKSDDEGSHKQEDGAVDSQSDSDHEIETSAGPMIELKLAVGDIEKNPAIRMLADADADVDSGENGTEESSEEDDPSKLVSENTNSSGAESAVLELLKKRSGGTLPSQPATKRPLFCEVEKDDDKKANASSS